MIKEETFYEVYGCDTGGTFYSKGVIFSSKIAACKYAINQKNKIAYGIPKVVERTTTYDESYTVANNTSRILPNYEIQFNAEC